MISHPKSAAAVPLSEGVRGRIYECLINISPFLLILLPQ
jgi:hypothetical protein